MNNSQSSSWSIAWMGGSTLRCVWAGANLDSSALKDAGVDCSTTWDGSEFRSPTIRTAKEWRNACVEEPTARNLNRCFALVLSSAATRPTCSGWIPTWPMTTLYSKQTRNNNLLCGYPDRGSKVTSNKETQAIETNTSPVVAEAS